MANKKVTITYNGSQILPQTELTSSTIIYGSTTLASDFVGTKTLNCANQVMSSNVVVGSKTLNCNGQLMNSNVSVISIGMVGNKPTNLYPSATYNGSGIGNGYSTPSNVTMTGSNSGTNAGTYTATYIPNTGYCWNDGTTSAVTVTLTINRASVGGKPSGATYNYTGGWFSPYNIPSGVSGSGTTSAYAGGNYTAYYTPDGNHCWSDGTTNTVTVNWTIQYVWNKYNAVPYYAYTSQDYTVSTKTQLVTARTYAIMSYEEQSEVSSTFNSNTGLFALTVMDRNTTGQRVRDLIVTTSDDSSSSTIYANECVINTNSIYGTLTPDGCMKPSIAGSPFIRKYYSYIDGYNKGSTHYGTETSTNINAYPTNEGGAKQGDFWYVKTW